MIGTITFNHRFTFLFFILLSFSIRAQVGINTETPNPSAALDVTSTNKGLLAPRMTTAERTAIVSPADGLMVYDTTLKLFYYYSGASSSWTPMGANVTDRLNFKLVRSTDALHTVLASELAAGGGARYVMDPNTLYEINGQIIFDLPVDLNNSYIHGQDTNNDILVRTSGNIFEGATGGSIRNVTLIASAGSVFNLNGSAAQNLIFRDCVVANSNNVGTISGLGLVFLSIIQFSGNTNGITYNNINQLLLSNLGWFGNNSGTYERLTGTFTLVEKQGGFTQVNGSAIGFDVSASGLTITGDAVMESVVFTGTNTAGYVKNYTVGTYSGYNFNNSWTVRSAGLPTESDTNAVGDFSVDYAVGTGIGVSFNNSNPSNIVKIGTATSVSTSSNLFRFSTDGVPNRLRYLGKKKRIFQITGSVSFQVPATGTYIIYIAKNGTVLSQYKVYGRGSSTNDIVVLPINGTTELLNNDYIEIFAQRYSGSNGDIVVPNMTVTIK
ncbi:MULTISPECIES: hypothetical protein [Chryseobacterium]|uniref:C1q domain-containing protein n=1 Tax=Chryseobacterium geocarposphaerae TaxID=1416776 RepID=A0ABU1L8U4_9FLAO|nr:MULTISPECIES: hypothetical protein [Chryseobacterium]MDR6403141.1 hypothetical protein [Chryseobacterium geocarposphaerae]MDR6696696.1 hypothetical protein [Chryseobacterium ginsenosidimutans]